MRKKLVAAMGSSLWQQEPIEKKLVAAMGGSLWQQEPIGKKLVLEFFVKIIYATSLVYLFFPAFFIFILHHYRQSLNQVSFN